MPTRSFALARIAVSILALAFVMATLAPAVSARTFVDTVADELTLAATGTGGVAINASATATKSPNVTVTIPPPSSASNTLRLSNDGATWLEIPWTTSVTWSLIDPTAGGEDVDGQKSVWVEGGDGSGTWTPVGSASILLDRTGPVIGSLSPSDETPGSPRVGVDYGVLEEGSGLLRVEASLDGVHYRLISPAPRFNFPTNSIDLRDMSIGGSWELGERTIRVRGIDRLGNVGEPSVVTVTPTTMVGRDDIPTSFSFPRPAVTGQLFTIQPNFDQAYRVPVGHVCEWTLVWGNEAARARVAIDETYGRIEFGVSPTNGKCLPWTFTLPHTPPREYVWNLSIGTSFDSSSYSTEGTFGAELGGTSRAITSSSLPLYYMLPSDDLAGIGETVRYRLYAAGGAPSREGLWNCHPVSETNHNFQQQGGTTFDCPVDRSEPWLAEWWKETSKIRWLVEYDPIGDRSRPTVDTFRVEPAIGARVGNTTTAKLSWKGHDKGTGVRAYTLQVSKNGASWVTISLPSAKANAVTRGVVFGASYRFRVRATDRAGNVGSWVYTDTVRPRVFDDSTTAAKWSSSWTRPAWIDAYGGSVRTSGNIGANGTFTFTGLGVGIYAPRAPNAGFAQVYVDGSLVATVNLNAAAPVRSEIVWSRAWHHAAAHTVKVRVLGTVGHPIVPIDAFVTMR